MYNLERNASTAKPYNTAPSCRYLKESIDSCVQIGEDQEARLIAYVDSSHVDCEAGRSTKGFMFLYRKAPISCASERKPVVPSSTCAKRRDIVKIETRF